jgi:hypothetical protein
MGIGGTTFRVAGGQVTIPVTCPRAAKDACMGAVSMQGKDGKRTVRLGGGEFHADPGQRDPVLVALTAAGRTFMQTRRSVKVTLFLSAKDGDGTSARFNRVVTLQNPAAATPLVATVGPAGVTLRTPAGRAFQRLAAGRYLITVHDRSRVQNFQIVGPGVNRKTGVPFVGTVRWTVTLRKGATYRFRSEQSARVTAFRAT